MANKKLQLTWDKSNRKWLKCYRGKRYILGHGTSKSDIKSYELALDAWEHLKAKLDADGAMAKPHYAAYVEATRLRREMMEWLVEERPRWSVHDMTADAAARTLETERDVARGVVYVTVPGEHEAQAAFHEPYATYMADAQNTANDMEEPYGDDPVFFHVPPCEERYNTLAREVERLNLDARRVKPPALDVPGALTVNPLAGMSAWERDQWEFRCVALRTHKRWTAADPAALTVDAAIDKFLAAKQKRVRDGKITPARYAVLVSNLKNLRRHAGDMPLEKLNGESISAFLDAMMTRVGDKTLAAATAGAIFTTVKSFVRWCWRNELTEVLPRNINDRDLAVTVPKRDIKILDVHQLKAVLAGTSGKVKLYILLWLNCGMTQKDVADLTDDEVDWKHGVITRKRSKTHRNESTPKVAYALWPETFTLLKQYRSGTVRALVGRDGQQLRAASIAKLYRETLGRLKLDHVPRPKLFRKSAASLLETHDAYARYCQYFLAHSPRSVADTHYVQPSQERFDEAVLWLGKQFGTVPNETPADSTRVGAA